MTMTFQNIQAHHCLKLGLFNYLGANSSFSRNMAFDVFMISKKPNHESMNPVSTNYCNKLRGRDDIPNKDGPFILRLTRLGRKSVQVAHWSKRSLDSPRLVGEFSHHVEYTDFSQHLINFWDYLIFCFLK